MSNFNNNPSNFKLDDNQNTEQNSSKKSKISNNTEISNSSESGPLLKELLTINELKNADKKEPKGEANNFVQNNLFDLDEKKNKEFIINVLKDKNLTNQEKIYKFNDIMYKLSYDDRKNILDEYKTLFDADEDKNKYYNTILRQEKKLKKVFISLLKIICNCDYKAVSDSFMTKFYIPTQASNIPFLEGGEEFIFANLINDAYDTFITKSNLPKKEKDGKHNESKLLSNMINPKLKKPIIKPIIIIDNKEEPNKENNEIKLKEEEDENPELRKRKFIAKRNLLKPILKLYYSDEFQNNYDYYINKYPELNADKRVKYIYEIIIEALFYYSVSFNEDGKQKLIKEYTKVFYETIKEKKEALREYNNIIKIKYNENTKNEIKNEDCTVLIEHKEFIINLFDYNLNKLLFDICDVSVNKNELFALVGKKLKDPKYYTIQKYIKENMLYNDNHLNDLFLKQIDIMLKNKILENVFNQVTIFSNKKYPFLKEDFLTQVHNSMVFVRLPTKLILGLTLKKFGIIMINKGRHDDIIRKEKNKNTRFVFKLAEFVTYKIIFLHEINFHYFLVLLFSNKNLDSFDTPPTVFINEKKVNENMDFGDKGEVLLFGTKVSVLYINAIIDLITLKSWDENKDGRLDDLRKLFLENNKETKKNDIKIEQLINLNDFTKYLYEKIDEENDIIPFDKNLGVGNVFFKCKLQEDESEEIDLNIDFFQFLPRGVCLNQRIYYNFSDE